MAAGLKELLRRMAELDNIIKSETKRLESMKNRVREYMTTKGRDKIESDYGTAYTSTRIKIKYDIDALEKKLDRDVLDLFIDKSYTITDIRRFRKLCKKYRIPLSEFKGLISAEKRVNENALDKLIDVGEISLKELRGCYETEETRSVGFRFKAE